MRKKERKGFGVITRRTFVGGLAAFLAGGPMMLWSKVSQANPANIPFFGSANKGSNASAAGFTPCVGGAPFSSRPIAT